MRRVVLEVVVPDDEFTEDVKVVEAVINGLRRQLLKRRRGGSRVDVLQLRPGEVRDFTDEEWKRRTEVSHT